MDDASVATLNPATMETLQLFRGDTIIVRLVMIFLVSLLSTKPAHRGKKRRDTGNTFPCCKSSWYSKRPYSSYLP